MKLLRTTALTAALMTAAVPMLTSPAHAWGWGGSALTAPYYGYGYGYSAYGSGYGTGYSYPGYSYAYHPVVRRPIYATTVGVRRHWRY
jgi:hypothetical protein